MANLNAAKGEKISQEATPDLSVLGQPIAQAFATCGELCTKSFAEWQEEIARFAHDRLERNGRTADALTHCRDVNELFGVQQEWLKQASQDYLEESGRVFQLANRLTQAWMQPMSRLLGEGLAAGMAAGESKTAE